MNINNVKNDMQPTISAVISDALLKLKKENQQKDGVDLLDITKKLSQKKFGKR